MLKKSMMWVNYSPNVKYLGSPVVLLVFSAIGFKVNIESM